MLPRQLCIYFANFKIPKKIQGNTIWEKFKEYFSEDFENNKDNSALEHIDKILIKEEMSFKDFALSTPIVTCGDYDDEIDEEFIEK